MKRTLMLMLLAATALLAGCKSAPDEPIIAGKSNDGWREYEANLQTTAAKEPYSAPERLEYMAIENDLEIVISADVSAPDFTEYPIYILEPLDFTQEMADRIIPALLNGAELYEDGEARSKEFIRDSIAYYTRELEAATNDPDSASLVTPYREILADLMIELERAQDGAERALASRELKFKAISSGIGSRLLADYGKLVKQANGTYAYEWTEEGRLRAAAAGNAAISGVCVQSSGRRMTLLMENNDRNNQIIFARDSSDGNGRDISKPNYDKAEAKCRADELLAKMGLECDFLYCEKISRNDYNGGIDEYYELCYHTAIPNTLSQRFKFANLAGGENVDYAEPLKQEYIKLQLDGNGLYRFEWRYPIKVKRVDMRSARLLPWDTVRETIETMLRVKTMWAYGDDIQNKDIIGRRLEIDEITLSYMQVRKDAGLKEQYYIPVWDACGRLIYKFTDSYVPEVGGGWLADENGERDMFGFGSDSFLPVSLITINAIDGSVINRTIGY